MSVFEIVKFQQDIDELFYRERHMLETLGVLREALISTIRAVEAIEKRLEAMEEEQWPRTNQ